MSDWQTKPIVYLWAWHSSNPVQYSTPVVHYTVPFHHSSPPNSHTRMMLVTVTWLSTYEIVLHEQRLHLLPQEILGALAELSEVLKRKEGRIREWYGTRARSAILAIHFNCIRAQTFNVVVMENCKLSFTFKNRTLTRCSSSSVEMFSAVSHA